MNPKWYYAVVLGVLCAAQAGAETKSPSTPDKPRVFDGVLHDGAAAAEASTAELQTALQSGSAIVLDARAFDEYAVSHIPGAKAVPGKPGLPSSLYTADINAVLSSTADKSQ